MTREYDAVANWDKVTLDSYLATKLTKALFRDDEISLVWPTWEGHITQVNLKKYPNSKIWKGTTVWGPGTQSEISGTVEAALYSGENGHVLIGEEKFSNGNADSFVIRFSNERTIPEE